MNVSFSHRSARSAMLMSVVIFLVVVECTVAHFLLHPRFPIAGFIITGLGLISLGWLVWDYAVLGKATTRVTDDSIVLRVGLRAKAIIPLRHVASISTPSTSELTTQPLFLDPTKPADPDIVLKMTEPVLVKVLGVSRQVQQLAFSIDRPNEFQAAVNNARASAKSEAI
jgi:hypothetical protein